MKLSRTTAYAISALLQLADADQDEPISARQLALAGAMPERFLLQVLRQLVRHGMLRSYRGVEGGFAIARPLREITVLQVVEALDGPILPTLPNLDALDSDAQLKLQRLLTVITRQSNALLASMNLETLRSGSALQNPAPAYDSTRREAEL